VLSVGFPARATALAPETDAPAAPKIHHVRRHARRRDEQYEAKTATLAGRRYIVCRNHLEAEKDAATGIAQSGASALAYAKLALS
jgi:hypothetical protein